YTLRSTDLSIKNLTVANSLIILFKGIPLTLTAFGGLSDIECKLVFHVHRVGRGVSMGNTCLLSVFQAITISSRDYRWTELKLQIHKYIGFLSILCWVLNMLVNICVSMYMVGKRNSKNSMAETDYGYCSGTVNNRTALSLYNSLLLSYDVLCLGLMIWASGSMVFTLYRHIHGTNLSPRPSSESRITQSIIVLVRIFVSFYTLSSILSLYISLFLKPSWWLVNTSALITSCYPTISPFVLMSQDLRISRLISPCYGRNAQ
ncbi:vomeronasal type-1 receptor 3-like, partial [Tupaia chinensis]|uniref:vomeronasal type-1 receptor 3-like n=1 Tax=Tupaia chinensis TaxID=246437 RepID=UPI0003C8E83E